MAKLEQRVHGDFTLLLNKIESGILNGSMSASLEDSSDFYSNGARCSVRVFERYSAINRVSLSVTLFQSVNDDIHFSAITAGGARRCSSRLTLLVRKRSLINLESCFKYTKIITVFLCITTCK